MDSNKAIKIVGTIVAAGVLIFALVNNLWAEPLPPDPITPTVTFEAGPNEIELKVETLTIDEIELLCKCVEAETENQSSLGKRLVADVILNRKDSPRYPNSITGVITQPGQFEVVANGRIYSIEPSVETREAVSLELSNRIDDQILFFRAGGFSEYGTDYEKVGDHYFSR